MSEPPRHRPGAPPDDDDASEQAAVVSVRCARCGGGVSVRRSMRPRNPFLPKQPVYVVCEDCGMDFEIVVPEGPSSSEPPWE
ncbi:MAG: hypothetical protein WKG00_29890 [Polyangiaceae bacterium]